jgi:DHA1 family bicyclomycin/chloramphenicol resistance-like MFS transporter
VVSVALTFYLVMTGLLTAVTLAGVDNLYVLIGMLFLAFGSMGLVIPSTAVLALEDYGPTAGTASAMLGTLQLVVGATVSVIVSAISNGTVLPLAATMFCCAMAAFFFGRLSLHRAMA